MSWNDDGVSADVLVRARNGEAVARELISTWMFDQVQAKVASVMRAEKRSHINTATTDLDGKEWNGFSKDILHDQVVRQSSLASKVLVKLIQGNTIDRAEHIGYLRMAIVRATRNVLADIIRQRRARQRNIESGVPNCLHWLRAHDEINWDLLELDTAIQELDEIHPRKASVITMRFFLNMTMQEIADALEVSKTTVEADWAFARAWLYKRLS